MKQIKLTINLTDELGVKQVILDENTTGLPDNSELIKTVAITILKSFKLNQEDVAIQDLLYELGIEKPM